MKSEMERVRTGMSRNGELKESSTSVAREGNKNGDIYQCERKGEPKVMWEGRERVRRGPYWCKRRVSDQIRQLCGGEPRRSTLALIREVNLVLSDDEGCNF